MKVHAVPTPAFETQLCWLDDKCWSVARLVQLAKDMEVMTIPLSALNVSDTLDNLTLRELAGHVQCVARANLSIPIILDEDGNIMDGRHRIVKAIVRGKKTIKAVRFDVNPEPCEVTSNES